MNLLLSMEANHMWLIIAIVVLFVGFPKIYALILLPAYPFNSINIVGIIARGNFYFQTL